MTPTEHLEKQLLDLLEHSNDPWHLAVARFILQREAVLQREIDDLREASREARRQEGRTPCCHEPH